MEPVFGHPLWVTSGILLMLVGFVLFRWARRNDAADEIAAANAEAAASKLLRQPARDPRTASKKRAATNFRHSMAQFIGIVGFLLMIAGLMSAVFGIFYEGS